MIELSKQARHYINNTTHNNGKVPMNSYQDQASWNDAFKVCTDAARAWRVANPAGTREQLADHLAPTVESQFPEIGSMLPYRIDSVIDQVWGS
jgi:hypothetical protein